MAKRLAQILCSHLLLTSLGCTGMFGPQGAPPDPLFTNGPPAESKAISGPPVAPPFSEPEPPANKHFVGLR